MLCAISELLPKNASHPFHIISRTSAGALNAALLACHDHRLWTGVGLPEHAWKKINSNQVYTPQSGKLIGKVSVMLLASMRTRVTDVPISLLDNSPLLDLLQHMLKLDKIQRNIDSGLLDVLSVTTSAYNTGESVSLY